jgi:hypothetical protein
MNIKEILTGIENASCRVELSAHINLIEEAIDMGKCDYNRLQEHLIASAIEEKIALFKERVFH